MRRLYLREASVARNVMAVAITTALTAGVAHAYNSRVSWALLVLSAESGEEVYIEAAKKQLEWTLQ